MSENKKKMTAKDWMKMHVTDIAAYCGLLVCIIIFSVLAPEIWSVSKISTLISNVIVIALLSVGAVFVYALGSMDISIGAQVGFYATLMVFLGNSTGSLLPGILIAFVMAVVIGLLNGAAGEVLRIHPVVSSLVFMMMLNGFRTIIYTKLNTRSITLKTIDYSMFKQTWLLIVVLVIEVLVVSYLFNFTKFGKNAKAIGANAVAAQQSGINLIKYKMLCYVIMGLCVVVAAIFQMGYTGSASDATGTGFEMNVMVALILGGMPLSGGMKSKVSCAVVGAFTYSLLNVGLPLIGVPVNMTFLIKAIIFIIVVLITCRKRNGALPR